MVVGLSGNAFYPRTSRGSLARRLESGRTSALLGRVACKLSVTPARYGAAVSNTYQLKVTLRGTKPPVWRRVLVPGTLTLERLHRVINDAMGWCDCHLHSFAIHGIEFGVPDRDGWGGPEMEPEKKYTLERLVGEKDRFSYTYDFGDSWVHGVLVEKVTPGEPPAPRCIAGARACPPEDCGGTWGYAELVEALVDENHERHAELTGWVPAGWTPDRFDLVLADRLVAKHGARPTTSKKPSARTRVRARP